MVLRRVIPLHPDGFRSCPSCFPRPSRWSSFGKYPLVISFFHGALRLRPPARRSLCWVVNRDAIYSLESSDLPSPLGVKAHSTQSVAASRPSCRVPLCGTFVNLRVGPHRSCLWDSMTSICMPLPAPLFSHLSCALPHKAGIWKSGGVGILVPKAFDTSRVPKGERLKVTYVTLVPRGNETLLPYFRHPCEHFLHSYRSCRCI